MGELSGKLTRQSYPVLSDRAANHLALLLQHRGDLSTLVAEIRPGRCATCKEIADWSAAITDTLERRHRDG